MQTNAMDAITTAIAKLASNADIDVVVPFQLVVGGSTAVSVDTVDLGSKYNFETEQK